MVVDGAAIHPFSATGLSYRLTHHHGTGTSFAGPYTTFPGRAAVIAPRSNTIFPLTMTCEKPSAYWCGLS